MRFLGALILAALLSGSTGCATFVTGGGPDQKIRITSQPTGAKVYIDGDYKGTTPTSVNVTRVDNHAVRIVLEGYAPYERTIKTGFNPWIFGNTVLALAFIIPGVAGAVIDVLDGAVAWVGGDVDVKMDKLDSSSPYGTTTTGTGGDAQFRSTAVPRGGPPPPSNGSHLPQQRPAGAGN